MLNVWDKWIVNEKTLTGLKNRNRKYIDIFYFDNLSHFKALCKNYSIKKKCFDLWEDCLHSIYISLHFADYSSEEMFYKFIMKTLLSVFPVGRVISLDMLIYKNRDKTDGCTLSSIISKDFYQVSNDTEEHLQRALSIIGEQTQLTNYEKDILTAIAFNVEFYKGIYEKERRLEYSV